MAVKISGTRVIICEGEADKSFFKHLIRSRALPQFDVICPSDAEGIGHGVNAYQEFLRSLKIQFAFLQVASILLVGDNDSDPAAAFGRIRAALQGAGEYGIPNEPLAVAASQAPLPHVVVMMLPWTGSVGCLETLCRDAVYAVSSDLQRCVDEYTVCSATGNWEITRKVKMQLQLLIAARCPSDPNTALRYAWSRTEEIIPLNQACFNQVADFLAGFDAYITAALPD